jgi:hypothetical protein
MRARYGIEFRDYRPANSGRGDVIREQLRQDSPSAVPSKKRALHPNAKWFLVGRCRRWSELACPLAICDQPTIGGARSGMQLSALTSSDS